MKKIISGGMFLFSGVLLFLCAYIPAAIIAANLGGWSTPPGRLWTALEKTGGINLWYGSIVLIVVGILLILLGCFGEDVKKLLKNRYPGSSESNIEG